MNLPFYAAAGAGLSAALFFGLWQWESDRGDQARVDRAEWKVKYEAEVETAGEWKAFAEKRAAEALEASRREGAAAASESERQTQLNWAYSQIRKLENETIDTIPPECGAVVLRDAGDNRLYLDALNAIANGTAASRDPADVLAGALSVDRAADTP